MNLILKWLQYENKTKYLIGSIIFILQNNANSDEPNPLLILHTPGMRQNMEWIELGLPEMGCKTPSDY